MNKPVEANMRTVMSAKVNMTFWTPTLVTHGVRAKTKTVEMTLRMNVTPTTASAITCRYVSECLKGSSNRPYICVCIRQIRQSHAADRWHSKRERADTNCNDWPTES